MYKSFYNLQREPFRLTPDPQFFFASATHSRGLAYLQYAFQQREGFVVITGSPGTGKTELMLNLVRQLPRDKVTLAKIVSSQLNADDLLGLIAASLLPSPQATGKGMLLKRLEDFIVGQARIGRPVLLLIDEAHNLPLTSLIELGMLSNFQIDEKPALQCFLLGQPLLEQKLEHPKLDHLKQRVIVSTQLETFTRQETQDYIEHRLRVANWHGDPHFSERAYSAIHQYSEGVPRKINALCNRVMLEACLEEKHTIDFKLVNNIIEEIQEEVVVPKAKMDLDFADMKRTPQRDPNPVQTRKPEVRAFVDAGCESRPATRADNVIEVPGFTKSLKMAGAEPTSRVDRQPPHGEQQRTPNKEPGVTPHIQAQRTSQTRTLIGNGPNNNDILDNIYTLPVAGQRNAIAGKETMENMDISWEVADKLDEPDEPVIQSFTRTQADKGDEPSIAPSGLPQHHLQDDAQDDNALHRVDPGKAAQNSNKSSIYQQTTDARPSGLLDKELLALASWYNPEPRSADSTNPEKYASEKTTPSNLATKKVIIDDGLLGEDGLPVTESNLESGEQPKKRPILDAEPGWLPLSPAGLIISILTLAILWWFIYGPGVNTTLNAFSMMADTIANW